VAALKRWPRLALTVVAANTLAGLLMAHSLFGNAHTAALVPSSWLGWFYNWQSTGNDEVLLSVVEGATIFLRARAGTTATSGRCITNSGAA
jgi:hypothetical protein